MGASQGLQLVLVVKVPLAAKAPVEGDRAREPALGQGVEHRAKRGDPCGGRHKQEVACGVVPQVEGSGRALELGLIPDAEAEQIGGAGSALDQVEQQQGTLRLAGRGRDGVGAHNGPVERVASYFEGDELAGLERDRRGIFQAQLDLPHVMREVADALDLGTEQLQRHSPSIPDAVSSRRQPPGLSGRWRTWPKVERGFSKSSSLPTARMITRSGCRCFRATRSRSSLVSFTTLSRKRCRKSLGSP